MKLQEYNINVTIMLQTKKSLNITTVRKEKNYLCNMEENKYRILVVDDEQDLCEILKFNLETEGYLVDTANSAEEVLNMNLLPYHLILLDVMMEGMSGFALAKELKANQSTASIPIIFLTAKDDKESVMKVIGLKPAKYLLKSMPKEKLIGAIDDFFTVLDNRKK